MEKLETVLVTGYTKAPQGTAMFEIYKHAGIILEIEMRTHIIVDVEFTFVADLTKKFFAKLIMGYCIKDGLQPLIDRIERHYFAPSQQAIIVALQAAVQRYWDCLNKLNLL